jgi:hypothetical protein
MKHSMLLVLIFSAAGLLAQDNGASNGASPDRPKAAKGQKTVRGCVSRFNGDFILVKQNPAMTYELHSAGKVKLGPYLGQQVEVTGTTSPSLSTSSDALGRGGAPSSITLTATSIKTITKECTEPMVPDK